MQTDRNETTAFAVTLQNLSSLSDDAIIDLLAHKTQLLVAASIARITDKEYLRQLNKEVEAIQAEIKRRLIL